MAAKRYHLVLDPGVAVTNTFLGRSLRHLPTQFLSILNCTSYSDTPACFSDATCGEEYLLNAPTQVMFKSKLASNYPHEYSVHAQVVTYK